MTSGKPQCPICGGTGRQDDGDLDPHGRTCRSCGGTGERRPASVDHHATIAPGMLRRCVLGRESVYGPFPAICYIDDDCGACDEPTCKWSARNIARRNTGG